MASKVSFNIDFTEASSYEGLVDGLGSVSLLKKDGIYSAVINRVSLTESKEAKNPMFLLGLTVQDEDEKGASLIARVLVGGRDKNNKPNSKQLWDLFSSMGKTTDEVKAMAANGQVSGETVANALVGKTVFVNVEAETYQGNTSSSVKSYTTAEKYADAVSANAHRKPRKADTSFTGAPAGAQAAGGQFAVPAGAQVNGAAKADPRDALKGLGLI